jgi:hypothetical protein
MIDRSVICIVGVKRVIALVEELAPSETPHKKNRHWERERKNAPGTR